VHLAACVQLIVALDAAPVYAIERALKPRRHNRRLGEQDNWRPIYETHRKSMMRKRKVSSEVPEKTQKASHKVKEMRLSIEGSPKYSVALPDGSRIAGTVQALSTSATGLLFLFAVIYAVSFLIKTVRNWMRKLGRRTKKHWRPSKGRVIRDRSLGGKEVFVPSEGVDWNPLGVDKTLRMADKAEHKVAELPSWWKPRLYIYVDESRKKEARSKAQALIKRLNAMRVSGMDYAFELIIELYRTCNDGCITARTSSKNIATSIFRYAVRRTLMLASEGIGLSYGLEELQFLCALSEMLKLGSQTAITTIHTETAVTLRAALLQVFVDVRSQQQEMITHHIEAHPHRSMSAFGIRSVINLLMTFPVPAAEAELIGSSITSTTTEKERIQVYNSLIKANPEFAELIGKLLGKVELTSMDD